MQEFILALVLALLTSFILWLFRAKAKLIWGSTSTSFHSFQLDKESPPEAIWTEKFYVQNTGRSAASNIEIVFSEPPTSYSLWSPREHSKVILENQTFVLRIPSLAPAELLIVDVVDIHARSVRLLSVNCPDSLAKEVPFLPMRQFGSVFNGFVLYLMFAGLVGTLYLALQLTFGK
ncbi:hypothetical protein HW561_18870 [Rhodobacteraceae bacterium B1Z28]|uniref:Uncharacterized protein n=1 Tax=Ruegeria haliotis TaxID=2747601 RepID=A0ABX2PUK8_9RHOB|nr:hypothetical protein [Ruegeria haliotis]NVO57865.1 hypothetical protein [Ruegeria haliotis]